MARWPRPWSLEQTTACGRTLRTTMCVNRRPSCFAAHTYTGTTCCHSSQKGSGRRFWRSSTTWITKVHSRKSRLLSESSLLCGWMEINYMARFRWACSRAPSTVCDRAIWLRISFVRESAVCWWRRSLPSWLWSTLRQSKHQRSLLQSRILLTTWLARASSHASIPSSGFAMQVCISLSGVKKIINVYLHTAIWYNPDPIQSDFVDVSRYTLQMPCSSSMCACHIVCVQSLRCRLSKLASVSYGLLA